MDGRKRVSWENKTATALNSTGTITTKPCVGECPTYRPPRKSTAEQTRIDLKKIEEPKS